jgi:hypothetical protein
MKPGSKKVARYSEPQRDLSAPGLHDIRIATPKPPKVRKVRQSKRVYKQEEPNWLALVFVLIAVAIAIVIGVNGGWESGGGSHASHSHRR